MSWRGWASSRHDGARRNAASFVYSASLSDSEAIPEGLLEVWKAKSPTEKIRTACIPGCRSPRRPSTCATVTMCRGHSCLPAQKSRGNISYRREMTTVFEPLQPIRMQGLRHSNRKSLLSSSALLWLRPADFACSVQFPIASRTSVINSTTFGTENRSASASRSARVIPSNFPLTLIRC